MAEYVLTKKAVEDLTNIWNFTFDKWSESQADKYYTFLLTTCQDIADHPDLGKDYSEILVKLKGLKSNRHIIFYRQTSGSSIEIIRILHERMDLKNRIAEK